MELATADQRLKSTVRLLQIVEPRLWCLLKHGTEQAVRSSDDGRVGVRQVQVDCGQSPVQGGLLHAAKQGLCSLRETGRKAYMEEWQSLAGVSAIPLAGESLAGSSVLILPC